MLSHLKNLASCEDICAPSFLPGQRIFTTAHLYRYIYDQPGQRTKSEDFPGSAVTSQPDAQKGETENTFFVFKGMMKQRYHKWPRSLLARFDQGCAKGGIVQVGTYNLPMLIARKQS